jgi:hypothetical protein
MVRRRRYTNTLGLDVYNIQGAFEPYGPQLSFAGRFRLDADFGQFGSERDPRNDGTFVPGLEQSPLDLMYAYLEGRNFFDGTFGFRLGRQYVVDALGWWSFDGAMVRLTTPVFLEFEAFAGFEQRGGLPMLSTSQFEADGVMRGDRQGLERNQWPSYLQESKLAPAFGFALQSTGVQWLRGRLTYRKVINRDTVNISPNADLGGGLTTINGNRVSTERIGYAVRAEASSLGAASGEVVYDFYNQLFSHYRAGLEWYTTDRLSVGADAEYQLPTFDGDSIFNWFSHQGMTTLTARGACRVTPRFDANATVGTRLLVAEGAERQQNYLASLDGRWRWAMGSVGLLTQGETGPSGHRAGADLTTRQVFDGGPYDALIIVSLYNWHDALRPTRDATSFTYVLGTGLSPGLALFSHGRFGVEWEHSLNQLVGQRFRVLATLDLTVLQ